MAYIMKNLHFIFIHIPITMIIFSFLFDLAAKLLKKPNWHVAGLLSLVIGTLGAIASVLTGPEDRNPLLQTHELFGKMTMIVAILLTLVRLFLLLRKKRELGGNLGYLAAALIGVLLVGYTGHVGGEMVHPDRSKLPPPGQFRQGGPGGQNDGTGQGQNQPGGAGQGQQRSPGVQGGEQAPAAGSAAQTK